MHIEHRGESILGASVTRIGETIRCWFYNQAPLAEAILMALSLHVVLFPVIWFLGWALPWPRTPVVTTIVEYNLENWRQGMRLKPEKVTDVRDPRLNR